MRFLLTGLTILCLSAPFSALAETNETAATDTPAEQAAEVKMETKEMPTKKATARKKEKKKEAETKSASRPDGLLIEDVKVGNGEVAKLGSKITVHYRGTLKKDGKEFDSSYGKKPITFDLLEGRLIKGWTEGIPGMKAGGKRKLSIPYALAYGERGTPDGAIPAKSDLNFEVELIEVK